MVRVVRYLQDMDTTATLIPRSEFLALPAGSQVILSGFDLEPITFTKSSDKATGHTRWNATATRWLTASNLYGYVRNGMAALA